MRRSFWSRRFVPLSIAVVAASVALGVGVFRLDTDPSLFDYFKPHEELRDGLEYVDRNGGSNPLTLVVAAADGSTLNHKEAYKQMWTLQTALENHRGVGAVVSLPVLMAEGRRRPLAFLLSSEHILEIIGVRVARGQMRIRREPLLDKRKNRSMVANRMRDIGGF